jgi:hypothetical protein
MSSTEEKEEDSLFAKHTLYSVPTPEGKPVRLAYTDTDIQQHSDTHTHTHIQQEDTTHVHNTEDTHTTTHTDSVIDTYTYTYTHTLTHNDVVYDTQEIDRYIHSMIDIH